MNTTQTIQTLIDQTKKLPNGLHRNKLVSRLEDAKIVSELMDYQTGQQYQITPSTPIPGLPILPSTCICPMPGVRDRSCMSSNHK